MEEKKKRDSNERNVEQFSKFNFGERFYYWQWYKSNNDEDTFCNTGSTYKTYYVNQFYDNFKEEVINVLSVEKYNGILIKATKYMTDSDYIKELKSKDCEFYLHYGINPGSSIKMEHLIAIILYTDFTEISYQFSRSFRQIDKNETLESIKKRNSKYFWWSRYLRELVEVYGIDTYPDNTNITEFFHGTSYLLFPRMVAKFKGPTSTTSQLEVAILFSSEDNGVILSLQNRPSGVGVEFFNVKMINIYQTFLRIYIYIY